jgi:LacI family transcriptional regulator
MSATIKQIAKELGISTSTVSRAISGYPFVAEKTREKVLKKAEELAYSPNFWAQNLVGSSVGIIGCVILEFSNPFFIPMVRAIENTCDQQGYIAFICESRRDLDMEKRLIERMRRVRVSGVVITPVLSDLHHLETLKNEGVPVVVAGREVKGFESVNVNNIKSGMLAGEHLCSQGFKKVGFIQSGDPYNIPEKDRLTGFRAAINQCGNNLETVYTGNNNRITGGEQAGYLWQTDKNRPEAVFCSNDLLAMGFVQYVIRNGYRIPQDVAVIGHDDIPFADTFVIPLTTIVLPKYELGQFAMKVIFDLINHPKQQRQSKLISLEPKIVIRKSCP